MSNSDSKLQKMKLISYEDSKFNSKRMEINVMMNPSSITHNHNINYNSEQPPDTIGPENKFKNIGPESISFELIFDGTGSTGQAYDVHEAIDKFKDATYKYIGDTHEPPYVTLFWGKSFEFSGRLTALNIVHSLFAPDGTSIRAKAQVTFQNSIDSKTQAAKKEKSSPDLTHVVTVKMGDNLPMLCKKIYGKSDYYLQVARINGLMDFRNLEPGYELVFPPVKK